MKFAPLSRHTVFSFRTISQSCSTIWSPFYVFLIKFFNSSFFPPQLLMELETSAIVLTCVQAAVDPLIYTLVTRQFRSELSKILSSIPGCPFTFRSWDRRHGRSNTIEIIKHMKVVVPYSVAEINQWAKTCNGNPVSCTQRFRGTWRRRERTYVVFVADIDVLSGASQSGHKTKS